MSLRIILYVALILAVFDYINRAEPQQQLPLVQADFPVCATVHNGPLQPHTSNVNLYPRRSDTA